MKKGEQIIMKKIILILLTVFSMALFFPMSGEAKGKKVRLSKTNVSVKNGTSLQLKLKNAKRKKIKWSSSNKYTVSVNKKGNITGKRLGNVTITAKYAGKKYKCRVRVCSNIDADRITLTYANEIFTEKLFKQIKRIEGGNCGTQNVVRDSAAIKAIYNGLASMKLVPNQQNRKGDEQQIFMGHFSLKLVLKSGQEISIILSGNDLYIDGVSYQKPEITVDMNKILTENREW